LAIGICSVVSSSLAKFFTSAYDSGLMENRSPIAPRHREPGEVSPWALAGLGLQFAVALVGFGYLGQYLDARFGTAPFGLLGGVLLGAGGTFFVSVRRALARSREQAGSGSPQSRDGSS
jgi:hypothetical protein